MWIIGCGPPGDFTHGQMSVAEADRFPQGEIASGKFLWIRQKEQKNYQ